MAGEVKEAEDPNSILIPELRRYPIIPEEEWGMPFGFIARVPPVSLLSLFRVRGPPV